jgi:hypothetical protein
VADGIAITAGTGTTILTDDTGAGGHAQIVKLAISTDGSATLLPADGTDGLLVNLGANNDVVVSATNLDIRDLTATDVVTVTGGASQTADVKITLDGESVPVTGTFWQATQPVSGTVTANLSAGTNLIGRVELSDGTNDLLVDTAHNDGESATENHLDIAAKMFGLNNAGTFDRVRATVSVNKNSTYAAAQTGTALWTPAAGKAVVVTSVQIQSFGTTAGTVQLWFGGAADTTFTRGTDAAVFDGEFAPSATNKPGVIMTFPTPIRGTADFVLRVTTTNAQSITFNVWGYEI